LTIPVVINDGNDSGNQADPNQVYHQKKGESQHDPIFIAQQMSASRNYDLIDKIAFQNSFGTGYFYLWRSATVAEHDNFTRLSQVKV
jgi:hypothetical protein